MKKSLLFLFSIYGFIFFVLLMLFVFPLVIIASSLGKIKAGNFIYKLITFWADSAMFLFFMPHRNLNEHLVAHDRAQVIVFNHISYIDIPIMLKTLRRFQFRTLAKAEMGKIPIFGFIYRQATVLVDRSSADARAASMSSMKALIRKKISIVIAPEGTFNMSNRPLKEFYNGAFKIAIDMQVPIQPVVFLNGYDRLSYKSIFSLNPGRSVSVFLPPIATTCMTEEDIDRLKQSTFAAMEKELIVRNVSWIRNGE